MEFNIEVFDTGNLIASLALLVAIISLFLNISDRAHRRTKYRIADARAYIMCTGTVDSHVALSFQLLNDSSRPLSLDSLHICLAGGVSLPALTAIECARLKQLLQPADQKNRILVEHATPLPVSVPAHGVVQIDTLVCLKRRQHSIDLLAFRSLKPSRLYTLSRIVHRFLKDDLASFDLVLSVHGRTSVYRFCPGSISISEAESIDDDLTIQE